MLFLQRHLYHLVDPSPWPIVGAFGALNLTMGGVLYMHSYIYGGYICTFGLLLVLYTMVVWWRDVVREATFEGHHTSAVQMGLRYGMLLFILSEVFFFVSFFWSFFDASLTPNVEVGSVWPPRGIEPFNPWEVPLLNTMILLLSGATLTWTHNAVLRGKRSQAIISLFLTIFLGISFTVLQGMEYLEAPFNISDGAYGSNFYMATGFHGIHVIIGTVFLSVCFIRLLKSHFTRTHHFGLEAAAFYWHFVDVVWLFLFVSIYWWGGV